MNCRKIEKVVLENLPLPLGQQRKAVKQIIRYGRRRPGEPMAVAEILSDSCGETISHAALLKRLNTNSAKLLELGFSFKFRRSNGRRLIEISRINDGRDGKTGSAAAGK